MKLPILLLCLLQLGCLQPEQNHKSIEGEWYLVKDNYKSGWVIYTLDYLNIENDSITVITSWLNRIHEKISVSENTLTIGTRSFPTKFYTDSLIIDGNKYVKEKPFYYHNPTMVINLDTGTCEKSITALGTETISVGYKVDSDTVLYFLHGSYYSSLDSLAELLTPIHQNKPQLLPFYLLIDKGLKTNTVIDLKNTLNSLGYLKIYNTTISNRKATVLCVR